MTASCHPPFYFSLIDSTFALSGALRDTASFIAILFTSFLKSSYGMLYSLDSRLCIVCSLKPSVNPSSFFAISL